MSEVEIISVTTHEEKDKIDATDLENKINGPEKSLIIYLMDGCNHCSVLKEELKKVKPELKKYKSKGGIIAKLEQKFMDLVNVENRNILGYPTMIVTQNGKQVDEFNDERSKEKIIEFLLEHGIIEAAALGGAKRKTIRRGKNKSHKKRQGRKSHKKRKGRKSHKKRKGRRSRSRK